MLCKNCGNPISDTAKFCTRCGMKALREAYPSESTRTRRPSFCPGCGSPTTEGASFCKSCGTRLRRESDASSAQRERTRSTRSEGRTQSRVSQGSSYSRSERRAPVRRRLPLPAIGALVVCAAAVIAGATLLPSLFRRSFSSAETYYSYLEAETVKSATSMVSTLYDTVLDASSLLEDASGYAEVSLELSSSTTSLLSRLTSTDMTWISSLAVSADYAASSSAIGAELTFSLNGSSLLSVDTVLDQALYSLYMKIPELSSSWLSVEVLDYMDRDMLTLSTFSSYFNLTDYFEDGAALESFLNRYAELILDEITDVTKESTTLTVNGITQKCTSLEAVITLDMLADIVDMLTVELLDDAEIKNLLETFFADLLAFYGYSGSSISEYQQEAYAELLTELAGTASMLRTYDEDSYLVITLYVDSSDEIIGRTISVVLDGEAHDLLVYAKAQSGKTFSLSLSLGPDGSRLILSGDGTVSGNTVSGSFTLVVEETTYSYGASSVSQLSLATIEVDSLDQAALENGYLNGSFTITPSATLASLLDNAYASMFSLQLTAESSKSSASCQLSVLFNDTSMASLGLTAKNSSSYRATLPSSSESVYDLIDEDEFVTYLMNIDWTNFLAILSDTDIPSTYKSYIQMAISSLQLMY